MMATTYVYRAYDRGGALLYVGITKDTERRLKEHRKYSKLWYQHADHFEIDTYPTREVAASMEAQWHRDAPPRFGWCEASAYLPEHRDHPSLGTTVVNVPPRVSFSG